VFSSGDSVAIIFLSFRASEARHGIQYFQHVLDAGFHRHDDVDGFFTIATQSPAAEDKKSEPRALLPFMPGFNNRSCRSLH